MSTIAVAKKDFQDGIRSRVLIGLTILFALFIAGAVYFLTNIQMASQANTSGSFALFSLVMPTYLLLPIVGVLIGYKAIVGERNSGSLKFLLGLPHTRRDVVFGKLLGRSGIVTVAILVGFAVGAIGLYAFTGSLAIVDFIIFTLVTVLLGVTFVSIAIAFSSATRSSSIATAGAITLVLLFLILWQVFLILVSYAANQLSLMDPSAGVPDWYLLLSRLNPTNAYTNAVSSVITSGAETAPVIQNQPFYLQGWFGFVILAFWVVVPIGLAYLRFQRTDL
jgi:ABC-2 type transport system permease protein